MAVSGLQIIHHRGIRTRTGTLLQSNCQ